VAISRWGFCGVVQIDRQEMSPRLRYSLVSHQDSKLRGGCCCCCCCWGLLDVLAWWEDGWDHVCVEKRARGTGEGVEWSGGGERGIGCLHLFFADSTQRWWWGYGVRRQNHITSVHDSKRYKDRETPRPQGSIRIAFQLVDGTVATNTNINTNIKSTLGGLSKQKSRQGNKIPTHSP
jgi:hypothetical protein